MTKEEIKKLIKEVISEEKKSSEKLDTFNKVELMLKHYNLFKKRITNLQNELNYVVIKKSVNYDVVLSHNYEHLSECEKIELKKEHIKNNILKYEQLINMVDDGLQGIKNDKYFDIIPLRYFNWCTNEEIAEKLNIDRATLFRNKNRLITELSEIIFPDEILKKIL